MYVEQMLRECEVCNRRFAVQYEYGAPRIPSASSDRVTVRVVSCPSCRHLNPLIMLMYAYHVAVKSIPGPDPVDPRVRPNSVRRLWASHPHRPTPRTTSRKRIARRLMVEAIEFMRQIRPTYP
jgi:hypothetical protein